MDFGPRRIVCRSRRINVPQFCSWFSATKSNVKKIYADFYIPLLNKAVLPKNLPYSGGVSALINTISDSSSIKGYNCLPVSSTFPMDLFSKI
jgi:hypothetical protein